MIKNKIESIKISEIDMTKCYFNPGCALSVYKPHLEEKILEILNKYFGKVQIHNICCHHDPRLPEGATIINNCAGCDRRYRTLYKGIKTISIWEILDGIENLPLPDYIGKCVSVHDSCSYRQKPQVHFAVRSLLKKMNIDIIESKYSGTESICCGDNFYPKISMEKISEFQKMRASQMPCKDVVVYCVSCIKSMTIGGKIAHHMADLLLNETTEPQELKIDVYHETLNNYIEKH